MSEYSAKRGRMKRGSPQIELTNEGEKTLPLPCNKACYSKENRINILLLLLLNILHAKEGGCTRSKSHMHEVSF